MKTKLFYNEQGKYKSGTLEIKMDHLVAIRMSVAGQIKEYESLNLTKTLASDYNALKEVYQSLNEAEIVKGGG